MDRKIDGPSQQPRVQLLGPQRLAANFGQRAILHFIAAGGHRDQFDKQPGMRRDQPRTGFFGLSQCQR